MRVQEAGPMQISFDEAAQGEFVNVAVDEDGNPLQHRVDVEDGGATPVIHEQIDTASKW